MEAPMLNVGVQKDTVIEARVLIMSVLDSHNAEAVKIAALSAFGSVCQVNGTRVEGCTFTSVDVEQAKNLHRAIVDEVRSLSITMKQLDRARRR